MSDGLRPGETLPKSVYVVQMEATARMMREGFKRGVVAHLDIRHDDWCLALSPKTHELCNCTPDVSWDREATPASIRENIASEKKRRGVQ